MKTRNGFVSNSSSSSFVIIGNRGVHAKLISDDEHTYDIGLQGTTQFGWGPEKITDIDSRINFAALQSKYAVRDDWYDMLCEVIRENSDIKEISYCISDLYEAEEEGRVWGYIDHQSSAEEGENTNTEMFESKDALENFIFDNSSYIQLDNDNY